MHSRWLVTFGLLLCAAITSAQLPGENADWLLKKETGNIRVYIVDYPNSHFRAFKAEALLDVPLNNVMAVMINPESCV